MTPPGWPGAEARRVQRSACWVQCAVLTCCLVLAATAAPGAPALDNTQAERARIATERRTADAEFSAAQLACQGKFLLTPCLDDAREAHRTALERQRRQLLLVDDAERRKRSADRLQLLQRRTAEPAPTTGPAALTTRHPAQAASAAQAAPPAERRASARLPGTAVPGAAASAAAAQTQRQQADYQRRQQAIQAHRQAITDRNARQDAQHPPAAGLPVPAPGALTH